MHADGGALYLQVTKIVSGRINKGWLYRYAVAGRENLSVPTLFSPKSNGRNVDTQRDAGRQFPQKNILYSFIGENCRVFRKRRNRSGQIRKIICRTPNRHCPIPRALGEYPIAPAFVLLRDIQI
jgi:hypothetical protein